MPGSFFEAALNRLDAVQSLLSHAGRKMESVRLDGVPGLVSRASPENTYCQRAEDWMECKA